MKRNSIPGQAGKPDLATQIQAAAKRKPLPESPIEFQPTGSTWLDLALGGGMPWGRIVNVVGDNSTGKTLLASEVIAVARKQWGDKLLWRYNDAEAGYAFNSRSLYGFDITPGNIIDKKGEPLATTTVEEWDADLARCLEKIKKGQRFIYVLDSLDSLSSVDEIDYADKRRTAIEKGTKIKGTYGMTRPKLLSEMMRLQAQKVAEHNCLLIVISQVRENIGVTFGERFKRAGGKALDFYAAQVVWLAVAEKYRTASGLVTGVCIKAQIKKNKVGKPFREAYIDLLFDYGIDDLPSCADLAFGLRSDSGNDKGKRVRKTAEWANKQMPIDRLVARIQERDEEEQLRDLARRRWAALEADAAPRRKGKF